MTALVRTLWPYARRHRRLLTLALAAMVGEVVTALLSPWPLKFVFDSVLFVKGGGQHLRPHLGSHGVVVLVVISRARGTARSAAPASLGLVFVPDR